MRIRSITIGAPVSYPLQAGDFETYEHFQTQARSFFAEAGLEVQTVRLATQPFPEILRDAGPACVTPFACDLELLCRTHGIDYCSVGTVPAVDPAVDLAFVDAVPGLIRATEMTFASALVASPAAGINLDAVQRAAQAVAEIARSTPEGFGNLRFAVLANCGPGTPFFPVAFHGGPRAAFAVAVEAADLAVDAFAGAATLEEARTRLCWAVEAQAQRIEEVCGRLETESGLRFDGIDFSLAPYPEDARSVGRAIENLGVSAFGSNGTLFAVAFTTRTLRQARYRRCGFSGLFFPVLEDSVMARRNAEGLYSLDSLLLYSTVCGTGLDTIPLPGDTSVDELAAILLDVATLALAADKPLTARLMPVPGKAAGELTQFDFPYFANSRIMQVRGTGAPGIFTRNHWAKL